MHLTLFFEPKLADMNIYEYTALNNRNGANEVVSYYGLRPVNHPRGLAKQLAMCVAEYKDDALNKVLEAHPDYYAIEQKVSKKSEMKDSHSNACGCNSCNGYNNADGQTMKSDVKSRLTDKTELLITGGIVLIGLAMVLKLMK